MQALQQIQHPSQIKTLPCVDLFITSLAVDATFVFCDFWETLFSHRVEPGFVELLSF